MYVYLFPEGGGRPAESKMGARYCKLVKSVHMVDDMVHIIKFQEVGPLFKTFHSWGPGHLSPFSTSR